MHRRTEPMLVRAAIVIIVPWAPWLAPVAIVPIASALAVFGIGHKLVGRLRCVSSRWPRRAC